MTYWQDLGLAMERVKVFRPVSASQLLSALPHLHREIQLQRDDSTTTRVLIVDSLPSLFYAFMGDSSALKSMYCIEYQHKYNSDHHKFVGKKIKNLVSQEYELAFIICILLCYCFSKMYIFLISVINVT